MLGTMPFFVEIDHGLYLHIEMLCMGCYSDDGNPQQPCSCARWLIVLPAEGSVSQRAFSSVMSMMSMT